MSDSRFLPIGLALASVPSQVITRPADTTAYASGDLVAGSTTPASVVPFQFQNVARAPNRLSGRIMGARLLKSTNVTANFTFRVHLFDRTPAPLAVGDNAALAFPNAAIPGYLDALDITSALPLAGATANAMGRAYPASPLFQGIPFTLPDPNNPSLFAVLEARGAYAPGNTETFQIFLDILQA